MISEILQQYLHLEEIAHTDKDRFQIKRLYVPENIGEVGLGMFSSFILPPKTRLQSHRHGQKGVGKPGMAETIGIIHGEAVIVQWDYEGDYVLETKLEKGTGLSVAILAGITHAVVNHSDSEAILFALGVITGKGGQTIVDEGGK